MHWKQCIQAIAIMSIICTQDSTCTFKVMFIARRPEQGSFYMRGHELAYGLRTYTGTNVALTSLKTFAKLQYTNFSYDAIVFVKAWVNHLIFDKARGVAKVILFDAIDKYKLVPLADAVLVDNVAQKLYYQLCLRDVSAYVLPHHVSNFRAVRHFPQTNVSSLLIIGVRPPQNVMDTLAVWGSQHGITIVSSQGLVPKTSPFNQSHLWSTLYATHGIVLLWGYHDMQGFCFKSAARFIMALDVGVPTVAQETEGFLEAAGGCKTYPWFVSNSSDLVKVLDTVIASHNLRMLGVAAGRAISARFSLQRVAGALFRIIYSLLHNSTYIDVDGFDSGTVHSPSCSPGALSSQGVQKVKYKY